MKYGKCNANLRIHANATNKKLIRMTVICRDGIQTMSRIGKKPINIPTNVEITISGSSVRVKGPKGELIREMPNSIEITKEGNVLTIKPKSGQVDVAKFWGLTRALMMNMIQGVSTGFEKVLEFNGIGFKAAVKGTNLEMSLGFSHPVVFNAPPGIEFKTEKSKVTISGMEKETVGQVAAKIRAKRPPEPYKGSGIFYKGETIIRKAGKKAATTV